MEMGMLKGPWGYHQAPHPTPSFLWSQEGERAPPALPSLFPFSPSPREVGGTERRKGISGGRKRGRETGAGRVRRWSFIFPKSLTSSCLKSYHSGIIFFWVLTFLGIGGFYVFSIFDNYIMFIES